jgi:hypothetical protein
MTSEHVFKLLKQKYGMVFSAVRVLQRFGRGFKPVGLAIRTISSVSGRTS